MLKKAEYNELVKKVNNINTTDISDLVKMSDYNTKINEIEKKITHHNHDKYIIIQEFYKLKTDNFTATLKQANLASKNDIGDSVKKTDFDDKIKHLNKNLTSNKIKYVLIKNE